ncbi:hypothetical protein D3C83_200930 [compost metagenome]
MKVSSSRVRTCWFTFRRIGSSRVSSGEPPRSSSQLALQEIFIGEPLISECGRATGVCRVTGEDSRVS